METIDQRLANWLLGHAEKALVEMEISALEAEMVTSAQTGVPVSVDLFVTGAIMYHLRVEHNGVHYVGRIYRGFSLEAREQLAIVDNGRRAVAEAAYEVIVSPDIINACILESEC